ncbi:MAG: DNA replication/repair protein RecF [Vampirovibrionia bacterium]
MFLKSLKLLNFRNYESLNIEFNKKKNVIVGGNAQGKTNLVEAIYFIAVLDSTRTSSDSELVKLGNDNAFIGVVVDKNDTRPVELSVVINPGKSKILKVNQVRKKVFGDFLGKLAVVSFSVDDLLLLRGAPADRRRYIDNAISQIYPAFYSRLQSYNKIKQQKQALLKTFNGYSSNLSSIQNDMIDSWNEQISVAGSNIIYLREKFLKEIFPVSVDKNFLISGGKDSLSVSYNSTIGTTFNCKNDDLSSIEDIKKFYDIRLKQKKEEEIQKGQVVVGPHRDDIIFYLNDKEAHIYASQGQQRTVVLSLKLAELELIKQSLGEEPLLILDDVLAELDLSRQTHLFNSIGKDCQTIITTTDLDSFKDKQLGDVDVFEIANGELLNVSEKV